MKNQNLLTGRPILLTIILFFWCNFTVAQAFSDTIEVRKMLMTTAFYQAGERLTPNQLVSISTGIPEAHQQMRKARNNINAGLGLAFVGGAFLGWPIGTVLGGGEPNWALAGIGAGVIGLSIPFTIRFRKRAINGTCIYNDAILSRQPDR